MTYETDTTTRFFRKRRKYSVLVHDRNRAEPFTLPEKGLRWLGEESYVVRWIDQAGRSATYILNSVTPRSQSASKMKDDVWLDEM